MKMFEQAKDNVKPFTCGLVYAHPGMGKTTSIGLMRPEYRKLIIDIDEGSAVLRTEENWERVSGLKEGIAKTDIFRVGPELARMKEVMGFLMSGGWKDYDLIVVDNLTEYEQRRLRELAMAGRNKGVPELAHYGQVQGEITQIVYELRTLPVHKIFTAWEQLREINKATGERYTVCCPSLSGKSADNISGICNVVAHLERGDKKRFFRLEATDNVYAKDGIRGREHCQIEDLI